MKLLRTVTIAGMVADPNWVENENAVELADSAFFPLKLGWNDVEWMLLYVDANGNRVGADSGMVNVQVTFRKISAKGVTSGTPEKKYWRGATQTGVVPGVLQRGDFSASGGTTRRPGVQATVRFAGAISSAPAAAASVQVWMQEG